MDAATARYFSDFLMASVTCLSGSRLATGKTSKSDSNALATSLLVTIGSFRPRTPVAAPVGAVDPAPPREGSSQTCARLVASLMHPSRLLAGHARGLLFCEAVARARLPGDRREQDRSR